MNNLQVFSFTGVYDPKSGRKYVCSHLGDNSGDYVPLAQAEALRVERDAAVAQNKILNGVIRGLGDAVNAALISLQSPATSRDTEPEP